MDEEFEKISLYNILDELYQNTIPIAENKKVYLQKQNKLEGIANIQKDRLLRAFGNIVQNAIEHTQSGRNVYLEGKMINGGWQIIVRDEGPGFSKADYNMQLNVFGVMIQLVLQVSTMALVYGLLCK
ncbi:HAMP domain-containing histidine kinase [Clostridium perfringens]|nr:HAMP domain-containing histidine kinase [Clostridium perfringens]